MNPMTGSQSGGSAMLPRASEGHSQGSVHAHRAPSAIGAKPRHAESLRQRVHFLHIGKTGGSAIKHALDGRQETSRYSITLHGHEVSLREIPRGERVFFFLRDPVSRFISGFYSRRRKGQPRYFSEWSPTEEAVFEAFETPSRLACALADGDVLALRAMTDVEHFRSFSAWCGDLAYFQSRLHDVLFIGFQERLDADFALLKRILDLPRVATLPADDVQAHRNPANLDRTLDVRGLTAIRDWYRDDIDFVRFCAGLRAAGRLDSAAQPDL